MELKHFWEISLYADKGLLIVPYGIETSSPVVTSRHQSLLIVPYGIETLLKIRTKLVQLSFNRTLWN